MERTQYGTGTRMQSYRIPVELIIKLKQLSEKHDKTVGKIICEAIEQYK